MGKIIDLSHHQVPSAINYDKLAKEVDLVIIRTQYGSNLIDRHYKTHHKEFQKRGVPTAAYAWLRGVSVNDMEVEATDFYNRTKEFSPTFWFADVEEKSMSDMRKGTSAFLKKLRSLGAKKVGIYVGHHLYKSFNLNLAEADAVWIPRYGANPSYPCDLHQYTDTGRLNGYNGNLDINKIISNKDLSYFTDGGGAKTKTIDQLADEVIAGKHDSGAKRKQSLGSQYDAVQKRVNEKLMGAKPKPESKPKPSGGGKHGKLKIVGVSNAAIVMNSPDRNKAKNLGTVKLGATLPLNGSVRGKNSDTGYWEVEYKGRLGYITGKFGKQV